MKPNVIHAGDFVSQAAELIENEARRAIAARGIFSLALSGGNTPKPVYHELAKRQVEWPKVLITFGDERCVPPDDDASNYKMAKAALLDAAQIPDCNVLRIRGEIPPADASRQYEALLSERAAGGIFRHDLILLGMGPDGHTASLFPGTPALDESDRLVIENFVPKFDMWRVTFTFPLLNAARHVCFLVTKTGKEAMLEEVFSGKSSHPCAKVQPAGGELTWMLGE